MNNFNETLWEPCDQVKDDKYDPELNPSFETLKSRLCERCHHPFYSANDDQVLCYKCLEITNYNC